MSSVSRRVAVSFLLLALAILLFFAAPPDAGSFFKEIEQFFHEQITLNPLNYTVIRKSENYFTVSFGYAAGVRMARVKWKHDVTVKSNFLMIEDTDSQGQPFELLYRRGPLQEGVHGERRMEIIPLKPSASPAFLKFSFKENSREAMGFEELEFLADRSCELDEAIADAINSLSDSDSSEEIMLSMNDPTNPLRLSRSPLPEVYRRIAELIIASPEGGRDRSKRYVRLKSCGPARDSITKERRNSHYNFLFKESSPERRKVLELLDYFSTFRFGKATDSSAGRILAEKIGLCGDLTMAFLALARAEGIPGRAVALFNSPPGDGHSLAEVMINGKWELYDPTLGVCFVGEGRVLSFEEIRDIASCADSTGENCSGRYFEIVSLFESCDSIRKFLVERYLSPSVFCNASPAGPVGPEWPMWFRISLDTGESKEIDVLKLPPGMWQGADHLGAEYTNNNFVVMLSGLKKGRSYSLIIEPRYYYSEAHDSFNAHATIPSGGRILAGASYHVTEGRPPDIWKIIFIPEAERILMYLEHNRKGFEFSYISISKIALEEIL